MSSTCSSDDEVISRVRGQADYITQEINRDYILFMKDYGTNRVNLTREVVKGFEKKWRLSLSKIEDLLHVITLDPSKSGCIEPVRAIIAEVEQLIIHNTDMMDTYLVPLSDAPLEETPEERKAREREERKRRMEAFQKGEHLNNP